MISKVLVLTVLAVSAMAMASLQNVEGGRDVALKEAKAHNPQIFNQNLGYNYNYKPKEEYGSDGYGYNNNGDCDTYGKCDKSNENYGSDGYGYGYKDRDCYEYGKCDKPKEEYGSDGYKYKDRDCYEYGNCDKSPYNDNKLNSYKKQMSKTKEATGKAGKYGVGQNYP